LISGGPLRPGTHWIAGLFFLLAVAPLEGGESEGGAIAGRVKSPDGGPFVGATVRLIAPGGSEELTRTDSNGEYRFDGLTHGFFYVSATCQGCWTIEQPSIELLPGATWHVNFVLERADWRLTPPHLLPCDSLSTLGRASSESGLTCGQIRHHGLDTGPEVLITIGNVLHALAEAPEDRGGDLDTFLRELIVRAEKHYPPETAD
jgi:hypothetical protein